MFNIIITALIGIVALAGNFFPNNKIWDEVSNKFGSTNFPTSLDSLTNPGATDSVATVSHSSQHANANDAIEVIEAKVGIGASTPVANRVFYSGTTGSSAWDGSPSLTALTLSGQGIFGSFISNASSTVIGNFNITGNSTSTNATSTRLAVTSLSDQIPYANTAGAFLPVTIGTGLSFTGGTLTNTVTGSSNATSTTANVFYSTTTAINITANKVLEVEIYIGTTTMTTVGSGDMVVVFNNNRLDTIKTCQAVDGGATACTSANYGFIDSPAGLYPGYITMTIDNTTDKYHTATFETTIMDSATSYPLPFGVSHGGFTWATTTPITSISIGPFANFQMSSTTITITEK